MKTYEELLESRARVMALVEEIGPAEAFDENSTFCTILCMYDDEKSYNEVLRDWKAAVQKARSER